MFITETINPVLMFHTFQEGNLNVVNIEISIPMY